jgi:hypothetical protein
MLRIQRRIEKLQKAFGLSDREPRFEHTIIFIDADGTVSETLLITEGRQEWIKGEAPERSGKQAG